MYTRYVQNRYWTAIPIDFQGAYVCVRACVRVCVCVCVCVRV